MLTHRLRASVRTTCALLLGTGMVAGALATGARAEVTQTKGAQAMQLGHFSVSLAVKDLAASRDFYEKLGFEPIGGNPDQGWQILRNGDVALGLFQGMFEKNIMTFNPGWDKDQSSLAEFQDVREIQAQLKAAGIELMLETDPDGSGPGHIVLEDPDGNQIMFDQHVE